MARIARWFLDILLDGETLRWWSGTGPITFDGQTYTGLGARWTPPERIKRRASMKSETIELEFDSSRQSDNADPVGHLLDQKWRRRQVRLRRIAWEAGTGPGSGDVLEDERGRIRNLSDRVRMGQAARITMEIESGALAYLERRMATRSPVSQKAVFPGDLGFDLIARLQGITLPWRTKYTAAGTVQYQLQERYEPFPRQLALGRFVTEGSFVAAFTNQQQRKALMRVYAIADHRINALDRVWVNGQLVRSTPLVHGQRTLTRLEGDRNENRFWLTFYDGRPDQTADSWLTSVEPAWTANHRLRGVAYVITEHLWDSDMANGYDYRFGGEGARLYDRRKDTTAGGSGAHRWDDPATWEYSTNAMVAADHYRSGIRVVSGSPAMWFGVGEAADAVPYAEFAALADHCDELVALKGGGTQKRYEVNGLISADESHDKNLQRIADQMAARAIDQGGRISIRPPIARTPVITLTDGDLVRGSESRADPGGGLDNMVNTVEGRFTNPANDYKRDEYPKVRNETYIEDDGGEIEDTLDLELEIDAERSQRLAALRIEESRRIFELEETYMPSARALVPGEWFVRQSAMRGFSGGKLFIAEEVERFLDGTLRVRSREVDPDQLVWDEETASDLPAPPAPPDTALDALPVPVLTVTPVAIVEGDVTLPAVRLTHAGYADFIGDEIIAELGFSNGQGGASLGIAGQSQFAKLPGNQEVIDAFLGLPPGRAFAIRFRAREGERHSAWSDFEEFHSTSVYQIGSAATVGGRSAQEVLDGIDSNAVNIAREVLTGAAWRASQEALMWIGGETVGAVAIDARELNEDSALSLSLLGARNGGSTAFILNAETVTVPSTGAPGSSAISLLTMRSQHDQNVSDITFLLESVDGASAQATLALDVNGYVLGFKIINEGVPANSGFYIIADNFAIVSPGDDLNEPFNPFAVVDGVVFMDEVYVRRIRAETIETEHLKVNSTAEILVAENSTTASVPNNATWLTAISAAYEADGDRLMIDWEVRTSRNGGDRCRIEVRIFRGANLVYEYFDSSFFPNFAAAPVTTSGKCIVEGVPAGSHTYSMDIRIFDANGGVSGFSKTGARLIFTELKKT